MKLNEVLGIPATEGLMKRSHPVISGDIEPKSYRTSNPPVAKSPGRPSRTQKAIQNMAAKANVPIEVAQKVWDDNKRGLDMTLSTAYSILTARTKRQLGLMEEKSFVNSKLGELVYGWKDAEELNDEEGNPRYVPPGYTKILELGGIYANEPGKGQGTKLMRQFLDSPEAQEAELIYLDPVPGLGNNFAGKSGKNEEEQVAALVRFYSRFGFKHNPQSTTKRMWLVKKGSIPDKKLPK